MGNVWSAQCDGGRCLVMVTMGDGYQDTRGDNTSSLLHHGTMVTIQMTDSAVNTNIAVLWWHTRMAQTQRQTRAESESYVYWKTLGSVSGITNLSTLITIMIKHIITHICVTYTSVSECHPWPGEVLDSDLLLAPHGAVVAGGRGGSDGVRQQADTELAPQSANYKTNIAI